MTSRKELQELSAKVGAEIICDAGGYVIQVVWGGDVYGECSMLSLISFAEKARKETASK